MAQAKVAEPRADPRPAMAPLVFEEVVSDVLVGHKPAAGPQHSASWDLLYTELRNAPEFQG